MSRMLPCREEIQRSAVKPKSSSRTRNAARSSGSSPGKFRRPVKPSAERPAIATAVRAQIAPMRNSANEKSRGGRLVAGVGKESIAVRTDARRCRWLRADSGRGLVELRDVAELVVTCRQQGFDGHRGQLGEMPLQALVDHLHGAGRVHVGSAFGLANHIIDAA